MDKLKLRYQIALGMGFLCLICIFISAIIIPYIISTDMLPFWLIMIIIIFLFCGTPLVLFKMWELLNLGDAIKTIENKINQLEKSNEQKN